MIQKRATAMRPLAIVRKGDEEGMPGISGLAAVHYREGDQRTEYRIWDDMAERIERGAFDSILRSNPDVRLLVNHDDNLILGRTASGTLRLEQDDEGLRYYGDPPNTTVGRDTVESIRRGDLDGSSFQFLLERGDAEWVEDTQRGLLVRSIRNISGLYDVGPVTFPAYEGATVMMNSVGKSEIPPELESWREERQNATERRLRKHRRASKIMQLLSRAQ